MTHTRTWLWLGKSPETVFLSFWIIIIWEKKNKFYKTDVYPIKGYSLPFGSVALSPEAYTANQLVMFNPTNTPSTSLTSWYFYAEHG